MAAPITLNANLNLNPSSVNASAKQVQQALGRITGQASEFQKSLDASTARVFAFGATTTVIQGITQSFKKLITTTIDVQDRLIQVNAILGASQQEFSAFRDAIFNAAKSTGQAFNTVADGAAELARQGLSAAETSKRLEAAMILTRVSGMSAEASVKALTAAINGFASAGLTAVDITNKIVAVDTRFAVSSADLAAGFSRAGSTAEDAGVSFDELLGLITAVEQRTARGGAVIGNAFKSIFTRLSRGSTIDDLKALGVEIDASQSGIQKLQALSNAIEGISDPTIVNQIKELAGGVYQINVVSSTLKDLSSETSIFEKATKAAANAGNDAYEKNAALNKSIASQINALVVSVTSLAERIGSVTFAPLLENLVSLATKFSEFLDKALDPEKGNKFIQGLFGIIGKFLAGPGIAIFTVAFLKIFTMVAKFAAEGFKSIMQIGSASERIKGIEAGIVDLLNKDVNLRAALANKALSQAQKEQAIIAAIKAQNALLTQQQQIVTNIANVAARSGVRGYNTSTGTFGGKGGRRFARGYNPYAAEEQEAMSLGASSSVKAYKTNLRGIGPAIVNTEEDIVNMGGKDAVIPRYAIGSRKGGNIPPTQNEDGYWRIAKKNGMRLTPEQENHNRRLQQERDKDKNLKLQARREKKNTAVPDFNLSDEYGMIVPEVGGMSSETIFIAKNERGSISALEGKTQSPNTVAKVKVPIYRLNKNELAPKQSQTLQREFTNIFTKEAIDAAHAMSGGVLPNPVRKAAIESTLNKGSAASAAGSVFESAVAAMLGDNDFADFSNRATGSLMDFTGDSVRRLSGSPNPFNIPSGTEGIEAKHSSNLAGGAAEKIYKILGQNKEAFAYKSNYKPIARKARGHIPNFAGGHIPNFAGGFVSKLRGMPMQFLRSGKKGGIGRGLAARLRRRQRQGGKTSSSVVGQIGQGFLLNQLAEQLFGEGGSENQFGSSFKDTASNTLSKATSGFMFGGRYGAIAGGALGGLQNIGRAIGYNKNIDDLNLRNQIANTRGSRFRQQLSQKGFGDINNFKQQAKSQAELFGGKDRSKEVTKLYLTLTDLNSSSSQAKAAFNKLTEIMNEVSANAEIAPQFKQLSNAIKQAKDKISSIKQEKSQAIQSTLQQLEAQQFKNTYGDSIIKSISGPASASLQSLSGITSQTTDVATLKTTIEDLKNMQSQLPQGDEFNTLQDKITTASQDFKTKVAEAAVTMQTRMNAIADRQKAISVEIENQRMAMINNALGRLGTAFKEGPVDVGIIKNLGGIINTSKDPEKAAQAAAELEMELSKAPQALRDALLKLGGLNQGKMDAAYLQYGVKGATGAELSGLSKVMDQEQKTAVTNLTTEQEALAIELKSVKNIFQNFKTKFNVDGIVTNIEEMNTSMKDAGTNLASFANASNTLIQTSSQVISLVNRLDGVLLNADLRISTMEKDIKLLQRDIDQLKPK